MLEGPNGSDIHAFAWSGFCGWAEKRSFWGFSAIKPGACCRDDGNQDCLYLSSSSQDMAAGSDQIFPYSYSAISLCSRRRCLEGAFGAGMFWILWSGNMDSGRKKGLESLR